MGGSLGASVRCVGNIRGIRGMEVMTHAVPWKENEKRFFLDLCIVIT